ncbi:MAG: 3-oxoacyl-[acyl-carrier-protein] reductase [Candidatus Dadabacteria bacterium]|nr:3-oxoacyl-[acyl-carrier-protein] reductase [Candidatus Dadabacteria bacterium]NIQ13970.1 3-oxoacyl-[acyl-carrier-protein] reductase [Candidatus Dadabacteria bacterium]
MELENKIALVTGASRGIGKQVSLDLASMGATVVANYPNSNDSAEQTVEEIEKNGGTAIMSEFDVSDFEAVQKEVNTIIGKLGGIHILINNAGITRDGLFLRMNEEDWDSVYKVNLKGVFNCTKAVIRNMSKQKFGRIVNIASVVGEMGNAGQINYSSTKAGVIGFTKSCAKEFGSRGITVNAVSPGFIETDITKDLPSELKQKYLEGIPLKRMGVTKDISGVISFLVSENASYITGEVIRVNGGLYM